MKAILSRTYGFNETIGSLYLMDGEREVWKCKTIELPDNGNQQNTSCIPEGTYVVLKHVSPTKGECFKVLDVPSRTDILIHVGNYASDTGRTDTLGCILPGRYFTDINSDGLVDITHSSVTMRKLMDILPDNFTLYII